MALLLSALSALNGSFTATNGAGEGYCSDFYGSWKNSLDCTRAIRGLVHGAELVEYSVNQGEGGQRNLPYHVEYGSCMIQVELAGPRLPKTFEFVPNNVIDMANRIQGTCVQGISYYGGFLTADFPVLRNWIINAETDLNKAFPTSTSFLTVSISNPVPDWLSPGNYDPVIPDALAQIEFNAAKKIIPGTPGSALATDLLRRANRFLKQSANMAPRGHRIPWWDNPGQSVKGNGPLPVGLLGPETNITDTASSRRRRRT